MDDVRSAAAMPVSQRVYGRTFWLAYLANSALVMANALTFRFAELIAYLGESERVAGDIVAIGLVVAILVRMTVSHWIDDFGTRAMWIVTTLLFISGATVFIMAQRVGWELYVARINYIVGLTGMFACSMTHIQNSVPPERRTEVIGNLGSSGFIGMILGAYAGDFILKHVAHGRMQFVLLFTLAGLIGIAYLGIVLALTSGQSSRRTTRSTPTWKMLVRYWPGGVVLPALIMGLGITVTTVFLTRFATSRHIPSLGMFFTGYAISAFTFRLTARNWSYTIGRHWMLVAGLTGHAGGHLLLASVTQGWHLILPSVLCGFGHALLFPAVVSLGAGAFPVQSRGAGTAAILAATDLGSLVSSLTLGRVIEYFGVHGFERMFQTSSAVALLTAIVYLGIALRYRDPDLNSSMALVPDPAIE